MLLQRAEICKSRCEAVLCIYMPGALRGCYVSPVIMCRHVSDAMRSRLQFEAV